jgi:hypothetical protein
VIRAEALAHAAGCASCKTLLDDHQSLSRGLGALAVADLSLDPPASVEQSLKDAFRRRATASASNLTLSRFGSRRMWLSAAAATLIIGLGVSVALLLNNAETGVDQGNPEAHISVDNPPPPPARAPGDGSNPEKPPEKQVAKDRGKSVLAAVGRPGLVRASDRPAAATEHITGREITTDFIPIAYGAEYIPIESGHIIRVRMPRSALLSFGLPMSQERANEQVKADILVSNDGMAQAIRFVQ